jgi:tetratricopeptide (TPR) repeat protein
LIKVAEPLPIDPQWNRARAMAHEHSREHDLAEVEHFWWAYINDLAGMECLSPAERRLAQALVWLRLGELQVEESSPLCGSCRLRHNPDEELQARAVKSFENSLKLAPELLAAYQQLATAYAEWGDPERSAAVHQRLVERFPENLDSLLFLATHYAKRDEPFTAREFVFRAQRLRPLDPKIKALARTIHIASARAHATARRWDDGRAELAAAEKLHDPGEKVHHVLVCGAALEFKAGEYGMAHRLLDRARAALGEAAPVWFLMAVEGILYALPKTVSGEFENRWLTALKKGRRSAVAGEMCRALLPHQPTGVNYAGREGHVEQLLDFLRRCLRIRWEARDLRHVLELLTFVAGHKDERAGRPSKRSASARAARLRADFATKACAKFPENAFFQFVAGETQFDNGSRDGDRQSAREHFERALELAKGAGDPEDTAWMKRARESLDFIEKMDRFSWPAFASEEDEDEYEDEDEPPFRAHGPSNFEEDEEDGPGEFSPFGPPAKMLADFARICRKLGVDPKKIIEEAARDSGFKFPAGFKLPAMDDSKPGWKDWTRSDGPVR